MEANNAILKERVKELESVLIPPPIFVSPLVTIQLGININMMLKFQTPTQFQSR
jgi:hypothetical protein